MTHDPSVSAASAQPGPAQREYLSFMLADETYAIDILAVREIRADEPTTRIAGAPDHVRGVVNLRGVIVPVVDLRRHLGLGATAAGGTTVIVVLELETRLVGMLVDALNDVIPLREEDIRPAPELASAAGAGYIRGLAAADERMLIVLDVVGLLQSPEMALFGPREES